MNKETNKKQTNKETNRQTNRQTKKQTNKQTNKETRKAFDNLLEIKVCNSSRLFMKPIKSDVRWRDHKIRLLTQKVNLIEKSNYLFF